MLSVHKEEAVKNIGKNTGFAKEVCALKQGSNNRNILRDGVIRGNNIV